MDRIRIGVVLLPIESTHDGCRIRIPERQKGTVMDPGSYARPGAGVRPGGARVGPQWGARGERRTW